MISGGHREHSHFSDMRFSKEEHTDSGLSDSAAGGIREHSAHDGFLERKLGAFRTSGDLQLTHQGFLIYADSHGRQFKGYIKHRVIYTIMSPFKDQSS